MPTTTAPTETENRGFKACRIADAMTKLASSTGDPADVSARSAWLFAEEAHGATWDAAATLAGVKSPSDQTISTTLTILWARTVGVETLEVS